MQDLVQQLKIITNKEKKVIVKTENDIQAEQILKKYNLYFHPQRKGEVLRQRAKKTSGFISSLSREERFNLKVHTNNSNTSVGRHHSREKHVYLGANRAIKKHYWLTIKSDVEKLIDVCESVECRQDIMNEMERLIDLIKKSINS